MEIRQLRVTDCAADSLAGLAEIRPNLVLVFAAPSYFSDPALPGWLADSRGEASYASPEDQALYRLKERNPNNFDIPRLVRFGVRVNF